MSRTNSEPVVAAGAFHHWQQPGRPLRWKRRGSSWHTGPLSCPPEQWYVAHFRSPTAAPPPMLTVRLFRGTRAIGQICPAPIAVRPQDPRHWLAWFQAPRNCKQFSLELHHAADDLPIVAPEVRAVGERDAKCHPAANTPSWTAHRPALAINTVWLPPELESLAALAPELRFRTIDPALSFAKLDHAIRGAAVVLNAATVARLQLRFASLSRLASHAQVLVDLEGFLSVLTREGFAGLTLGDCCCGHSLTTARVAYADHPTRGFALMDTFPYGEIDDLHGFVQRAIVGKPAWKRFADATACATLLESQTHSSARSGHVLCAAQPVERGELICTDLPQLTALPRHRQIAPRLARHALRTLLGLPVPDHYQYWNRWDEAPVVVRDIADVGRRYAPLRTVRWSAADDGAALLGLELAPTSRGGPLRRIVLDTGRIDQLSPHDGVPPEPMMILMKHLAREAREAASWTRRDLQDTSLVWRFESRAGTKYVSQYDSAAHLAPAEAGELVLRIRTAAAPADAPEAPTHRLRADPGLFGDGAFEVLDELYDLIRDALRRDSVVDAPRSAPGARLVAAR